MIIRIDNDAEAAHAKYRHHDFILTLGFRPYGHGSQSRMCSRQVAPANRVQTCRNAATAYRTSYIGGRKWWKRGPDAKEERTRASVGPASGASHTRLLRSERNRVAQKR